jgi:asparagine synthase (glutamine-hydrolysing)
MCIRDRHYQVQSNTIYFASEIKQLVIANNPAPNFNALVNFLLFNAENYSAQTAFDKVFVLRGGQYVEVDIQDLKIDVKQWHSNQWSQSLISNSFEENVLRFEELSANAIMLQSRNAVKQGIALSAGLDSSWLFYGLKNRNSVVNAFTVGVTGDWQDERIQAKKVFDAFAGPDDHFTAVAFKSDELIAELDDLSYVQEEPFTDPSVYMQYRMMKIAAQQGVRVMLSGQGADELLLGYERYSLLESLPLSIIKKLRYFQKLSLKTNASFTKFLIFQQMFAKAKLRTARVKHLHRGMFADKMQLAANAIWESEANSYSRLPALYANEIEVLHLPKLLRYEDRNGGAFGIEGRQPFLENQFADFIIQLPQDHKLKEAQTKRILRSALGKAGLTNVANQKTKIGFTSPDYLWQNAQGEMASLISNSRLLKEVYRALPNYHANPRLMWKLQSIARWEKMYNL